jgi:cbb3-type cytochrome oxidase maturation protein
MNILGYLVPVSIGLGIIGLRAFFWAFKTGQYADLEGAAERILLDDEDKPC